MRYLFVKDNGIFNYDTGELHDKLELDSLMQQGDGIIAGRNLYPLLCGLEEGIRKDEGWTMRAHGPQRKETDKHVSGMVYFSRITYRPAKKGRRHNRRRPPAIKWLVLNLELFTEHTDTEAATFALMQLAVERGVKLRYSPGTIGSSLIRASPEWKKGRNPAPWFISESTRELLPGNLYSLRRGFKWEERGLYLDQSRSHHTIAATVPLPDPSTLHRRGSRKCSEWKKGDFPLGATPWLKGTDLLTLLHHMGVILVKIKVNNIAAHRLHLYPRWAQRPGTRYEWIWMPELRLLDNRATLCRPHEVFAGYTSVSMDPVLREYGEWCLSQLERPGQHPVVKPALHAAYGMLAVRRYDSFVSYTVHGRGKPPRAEDCRFPLLDGPVYRSTVERRHVPALQNVVARGVIEAEMNTRSLELARTLEAQGIKVLQIYADGIIIKGEHPPLLPGGWRVSFGLDNLRARTPNSVISDNLVKLPGVPNGRRTSVLLTPPPEKSDRLGGKQPAKRR